MEWPLGSHHHEQNETVRTMRKPIPFGLIDRIAQFRLVGVQFLSEKEENELLPQGKDQHNDWHLQIEQRRPVLVLEITSVLSTVAKPTYQHINTISIASKDEQADMMYGGTKMRIIQFAASFNWSTLLWTDKTVSRPLLGSHDWRNALILRQSIYARLSRWLSRVLDRWIGLTRHIILPDWHRKIVPSSDCARFATNIASIVWSQFNYGVAFQNTKNFTSKSAHVNGEHLCIARAWPPRIFAPTPNGQLWQTCFSYPPRKSSCRRWTQWICKWPGKTLRNHTCRRTFRKFPVQHIVEQYLRRTASCDSSRDREFISNWFRKTANDLRITKAASWKPKNRLCIFRHTSDKRQLWTEWCTSSARAPKWPYIAWWACQFGAWSSCTVVHSLRRPFLKDSHD